MARRQISIDEKIERAEENVAKLKAKYDAAVKELSDLIKKKQELQKEELISTLVASSRSYDEIMDFLNFLKGKE